jgi:hypothetical protein
MSKNKISIINYNEPIIKDTAIILVYYNFTHSIRIMQNLLLIKHTLEKANIPFFIGEIAYKDSNYFLDEGKNIYQYKTNSYMFYKENIINIIESKISDEYKKIIIMDSDLIFNNMDWYNIISNTLDNFTICQCFENAYWLTPEYLIGEQKKTVIIKNDEVKKHPGFIWGFNREWLRKNKLIDLCVIGGGDVALISSLKNDKLPIRFKYMLNIHEDYKNKIRNTFSLNYAKLDVYHLHHGFTSKRQYVNRYSILNNFITQKCLNSIVDLVYANNDGIYEWKEIYREEINKKVLEYFLLRNDDNVFEKN